MPKGNLPTYRGQICDENRNVLGKAVLWVQTPEERKSEKSPVLRGQIELDKNAKIDFSKQIRIAFWPNSAKDKQPK